MLPVGLPLLDDRFPLPIDRPFTLRQADEAGVPAHRLRALLGRGYLRRVLKGVYVASQVPDDRHLRGQALALVVPHTGVVTDWCACWLWTGVEAPGDHLGLPPLTVFHRHRHTRLNNSMIRGGARTFRPSDITDVHGFSVTTPLRTAWDLGRLQHRDRAFGGMDALMRHGSFDLEDLVEGVARFKGERGVVQLRELAPLVDARAESPGESVLRLRWLDMPSLPRPTPQLSVTVDGIEVYRLDLAVPQLKYGCEYDGESFHTDLARDEARRDDLRVRFGWRVVGVRKANVFGPRRDIEEILQRGIDEARRARGRPTSSS